MSADILEYQSIGRDKLRLVAALFLGHVIEIGGLEYRLAQKDQPLFKFDFNEDQASPEDEHDDGTRCAMQAGIFQRYADRWVMVSSDVNMIYRLMEDATEKELQETSAKLAFDTVIGKRDH